MAYKATSKKSTKTEKPTKKISKKSSDSSTEPVSPKEKSIVSNATTGDIFIAPPQAIQENKLPKEDAQKPHLSIDDIVGEPITTPPSSGFSAPMESQGQYSQPQPQQYREQQPQQDMRPRYRTNGDRGGYGMRNSGGGYDNRYRRYGRPQENRWGDRGFNRPMNGAYQQRSPIISRPSFTQDTDVATETVSGVLDLMPEGHGFLRPLFRTSEKDIYISVSQIRRFLLRNGDMVEGQARPPKDNERYWGLLKVEKINGYDAEKLGIRPKFEELTPVYPNKQLRLEMGEAPISNRIIDLMAPIGFGQRGLIVSPPKAGKTTILKEIAAGITANYPEVHLMAALIGERPEEVTDLSRNIKGEVLASNFDESPSQQVRIAEVALDRAKRLVEMGYDVVVLLDSITRLARAYNLVVNPSGRTLSGGFDPAALYPAKKFLGAARCVEISQSVPLENKEKSKEASQEIPPLQPDETIQNTMQNVPQTNIFERKLSANGTGGSLTVIGTALVDTGSRMDDLIYEEFKGTGNMELHLSRSLQERRIFPAIDVRKSGTRHDELLLGEHAIKYITTLRHMISLLNDEETTLTVVERLKKTKSNNEFLESLSQG
jgi:transcription termination factor Rho